MKNQSVRLSTGSRVFFFAWLSVLFIVGPSLPLLSQNVGATAPERLSPLDLPGGGLSHLDFFYAGEARQENMYIVKNGEIVWNYTHPAAGEISDAVLLSNFNVLFAHQDGITEVTPDKKVVWNYNAPEGCEIHTAQPIGKEHVIFLQNGKPAKLLVVNKITGKIVKDLVLPVGNPNGVHGHFRHARLTNKGTYLVAHMDMGKVCEYDADGKALQTIDAPGVWSAQPLSNGNILITCQKVVREINPAKQTVWECSLPAIQGYAITSPQTSVRLSNGNTIVTNWFNQWSGDGKVNLDNPPVQAVELTPEKKVIWAIRAWTDPVNLGPSTIIVPLNEPRTDENRFFGEIR